MQHWLADHAMLLALLVLGCTGRRIGSDEHSMVTDDSLAATSDPKSWTRINDQGLVNILGDDAEVQKFLQMSLAAIAFERKLLCPERFVSEAELNAHCFAATKDLSKQAPVVRLEFRLNDVQVETETVDEQVIHIEPAPCQGPATAKAVDHYEGAATESKISKDAAAAISHGIRERCPDVQHELTDVKKIHAVQTKVVEGLIVRALTELGSGALHIFQVLFNTAGESVDLVWPSSLSCEELWRSTQSLETLHQLADPAGSSLLQTSQTAGGHISALDGLVPLHSPADLQSLLQRSEDADLSNRSKYDPRQTLPKCFPNSIVTNQGSCGSCWAMAAVGAVSDRLCIANPRSMLEPGTDWRYTLSVQQVLSCHRGGGCDGGHAHWVYQPMMAGTMKLAYTKQYPYTSRCFVTEDGVTQDWGTYSCYIYRDLSNEDPRKPCGCVEANLRPTTQPVCNGTLAMSGRSRLQNYNRLPKVDSIKNLYQLTTWTNAEVVQMIQSTLFEEGPVYASFDVYEDFSPFIRRTGGHMVYRRNDNQSRGGHAVVMVGWGVAKDKDGTPYWSMRNSWGVDWANNGYYKHIRGINDCNVESDIVIPKVVKQEAIVRSLRIESVRESSLEVKEYFGFVLRPAWALTVKCSSPCRPVFAVLPELKGDEVSSWDGSKCCCDNYNYRHGTQCAWVPKSQLHEGDWLKLDFGKKACGRYNLGRGLAQTEEGEASLCSSRLEDDVASGMHLTTEQLDAQHFRVSIDLGLQPELRGNSYELLVKAKISGTDVTTQQLYRIVPTFTLDVHQQRVKRLFKFNTLAYNWERVDEPYKVQTYWGSEWKTKEFYVLRITATCSEDCNGTAVFEGLRTRAPHHPRGTSLLSLREDSSEEPGVKTWSARIDEYPPGKTSLHVSVWPAGETNPKAKQSRKLTVEIPALPGEEGVQGALWNPFEIKRGQSDVQEQAGGLFRMRTDKVQTVSAVCSRRCSIKKFRFVIENREVPVRVLQPPHADQVVAAFNLNQLSDASHPWVTALIVVQDEHGGTLVKRPGFYLGKKGAVDLKPF